MKIEKKPSNLGTSLSAEDIQNMPYVEFISLLQETNRCPGGKKTIHKIIHNSCISRQSKVLEVGSNTGFTSLELARVAKCKVVGVEPVRAAVDTARAELGRDTKEIQSLVDFKIGSAYELPFPKECFDLVVAGGATSFMADKHKALEEYFRVIKYWGFLSITNLCYLKKPPSKLVDKVSEVLGVKIEPWSQEQWLKLFEENTLFENYLTESYELEHRSEVELIEYVEYFVNKAHISRLPEDVKEAIRSKWLNILRIFNENHQYLGYVMVLFRKRHIPEEPELFMDKE